MVAVAVVVVAGMRLRHVHARTGRGQLAKRNAFDGVPRPPLPLLCAAWTSFAPSIPVVLYHGPIEERAKIRAKRMTMGRTGVSESFPVVVTSYEIVMNDRKHLQVRPGTLRRHAGCASVWAVGASR